MLRRIAVVCLVLCPPFAIATAPASASTAVTDAVAGVDAAVPVGGSAGLGPAEQLMLDAINAARLAHGLPPLREAARISRSSRAFARRMMASQRFAHARNPRVRGYGAVAEILGRMPNSTAAVPVIDAWLASPTHRRLLLTSDYRRVGIGMKKGSMAAGPTTVWVVRFAR